MTLTVTYLWYSKTRVRKLPLAKNSVVWLLQTQIQKQKKREGLFDRYKSHIQSCGLWVNIFQDYIIPDYSKQVLFVSVNCRSRGLDKNTFLMIYVTHARFHCDIPQYNYGY